MYKIYNYKYTRWFEIHNIYIHAYIYTLYVYVIREHKRNMMKR